MAVNNPILNPIRFYDPTKTPNYADRWPNLDNVDFYTEWQKGVFASNFYRDHRLNEEMTLQFRWDSSVTDGNIYVYKMNTETGVFTNVDTIVPVNVSPSGWTGTPVYNYYWTPTETGVYYFDFDGGDYISGRFIVHNDEKFLKRLVEIKYYNFENKNGIVYFQNEAQVFTGVAYFQGTLLDGEPANDLSVFTDDPGETTLLNSTPQRTALIELSTYHYTYNDVLNYIFSNSEIFINGIQYQNKEAIKPEKIQNSDLRNGSLQLFQKNNDHFTK